MDQLNFEEDAAKDADEDLSKLLDSALNDFGKTKLSDDDFDEFMANQDKKEVQKAAKDFQQMLEQMVTNIEKESEQNKQKEVPMEKTPSGSSATEAHFMQTFNSFLQQSNTMTNATDEQGFLKAMKDLDDSNNPMLDGIMEMIVQTALSKDLMYPAVKDMLEKFETYLKENAESLDKSLLEQYLEQQKILQLLALEYEAKISGADKDEERSRTSKIAKYWMELQKHGLPPAEVVGGMPEGWMCEDPGLPDNMDLDILKKILDGNQ